MITHDEDFVEELGKRAHAEYYYRVSKDANNKSTIKRHYIIEEQWGRPDTAVCVHHMLSRRRVI